LKLGGVVASNARAMLPAILDGCANGSREWGFGKVMSGEKPYTCPPSDAEGNYKYYLLGNRPVRIEHDEQGLPYRAEAPDRTSSGELKADLHLLGRVMCSSDVESIGRDKFIELCAGILDR
jgi:hypothetical protein